MDDLDEDEQADDVEHGHAATPRRLPAYLSRKRRWGKWIPTHGSRPSALYHADSLYEVSLTDLPSPDVRNGRIEHVAEKGWCSDRDLDDLERALQDLGLRPPP